MKGAKIKHTIQAEHRFFYGEPEFFECGLNLFLEQGSSLNIGKHKNKYGKLAIGDKVYINKYVIIDCHFFINIEKDVMIGPNCYISDFDHGLNYSETSGIRGEDTVGGVNIRKGVWIGAGVIILKGVEIGEGSVIGAGSLITKNVPPYSIVVGNPQRILKKI